MSPIPNRPAVGLTVDVVHQDAVNSGHKWPDDEECSDVLHSECAIGEPRQEKQDLFCSGV